MAGPGQDCAAQEAEVGDGPVFQWTEQHMTDDAADRLALRKVQNVDEVVPAGIQEDGVLIGSKFLGMDAEKLVDGAHFQITVAEGCEAGLDPDLPVVRCKGLLTKGNVHVKWPEG